MASPSPRGDDCRCGACGGAIADQALRARAGYPLGETTCPHCGARVAKLDSGGVPIGGIRLVGLALGIVGINGAIREWPDGTVWPYVLMGVTGLFTVFWFRWRGDERVLIPVAKE